MSGTIDLSQLPRPDVIETLDFETLFAQRKARLLELTPIADRAALAATLKLESEPIVKLLQENAYRELLLRAHVNDKARALLLAFARGANLDHIGATYYQETRLLVRAADPTTLPPTPAVYETDDDYRRRLALKPQSYSTAGPSGAYIFHGLSADGRVKDVSAVSPIPGEVVVYVLSREGNGAPSDAILAAVSQRLNAATVRPLCEGVTVKPATIKPYVLEARLYTYDGPDRALVLKAAQQKVLAYMEDHHRLGHDITVSGLTAALHQPGVQRVALNLGADIVCADHEAGYCTRLAVTFAGVAL